MAAACTLWFRSAVDPEAASSALEQLRLLEKLGGGASGDVYAGEFQKCRVAVKVVQGPVLGPDSPKQRRMAWMREKRTALVLRRRPHRHCIAFSAAFEAPRDCFDGRICKGDGVLVMELGVPLLAPIGEREELLGPVVLRPQERGAAARRAAKVLVGLANALAHLHGQIKTIHRDVKPDNLLVVDDRVCLCDFSASRTQLYARQLAMTRKGIGTMGFLAPEMYERGVRYCSKIDIWALGCTGLVYFNDGRPCSHTDYHDLTGVLQWARSDADKVADARARLDATIARTIRGFLPEEEGLEARLREVLVLCIRANPADRPSAASLLRALPFRELVEAAGLESDQPAEDIELLEDQVEKSVAVADLLQGLLQRFASSQGSLTASELDLLRDGLHRALEEKDLHSLELMTCWLDFLRRCPDVPVGVPDSFTGRTLLHAVVKNHRAEALLDLLEDHCEQSTAAAAADGSAGRSMEELVDVKDDDGRTPLWHAAGDGTAPDVCLRLLELGATVDKADKDGVTPLEHCASAGFERPGERRADVLTVLVAFGARVPTRLAERCTTVLQDVLRLTSVQARRRVAGWQDAARRARDLRRRLRSVMEGPKEKHAEQAQAAEPAEVPQRAEGAAAVAPKAKVEARSRYLEVGGSRPSRPPQVRVADASPQREVAAPAVAAGAGGAAIAASAGGGVAAAAAVATAVAGGGTAVGPSVPAGAAAAPASAAAAWAASGDGSPSSGGPAGPGSPGGHAVAQALAAGLNCESFAEAVAAVSRDGGDELVETARTLRLDLPEESQPAASAALAAGAAAVEPPFVPPTPPPLGAPAPPVATAPLMALAGTGTAEASAEEPSSAAAAAAVAAAGGAEGGGSAEGAPPLQEALGATLRLPEAVPAEAEAVAGRAPNPLDDAEGVLRTYLLRSSHHHLMTAFRLCDRHGKNRVTAEEFASLLEQAAPGSDVGPLRQRLKQRWANGLGFREFSRWLREPRSGPGEQEVDARRRLAAQHADRRERPERPRTSSVVGRAPPRSAAPGAGHRGQSPSSPDDSRISSASERAGSSRSGSPAPRPRRRRPSSGAPPTLRRRVTPEPERSGLRGSSQVEARLRAAFLQVFRRFDANAAGGLTAEQFEQGQRAVAEACGAVPVSRAEDFAEADKNHDNIMEVDEWLEWMLGHTVPALRFPRARLASRLESWLAQDAGP